MKQLRFAPIIRVSTEKQASQGESLKTQRDQIVQYVESLHGTIPEECWKYCGQEHATVGYERALLDNLLADSSLDIFDAVICVDVSRWSRDNMKNEQGLAILRQNKIRFFVGTTEMNLEDEQHVLIITMNVVFGQFAARQTARKSHLNKYRRAKESQIPTTSLPWGRKYDRKTGTWSLDPDKVDVIKRAAEIYLNGGALWDAALKVGMPMTTLAYVLKKKLGSTFTVHFKDLGEVTLNVPPLLDEATIQKIQARLTFNRKNNKTNLNKYVLGGFLYCYHCGGSLIGQTQRVNGHEWKYYFHRRWPGSECRHFSTIPLDNIENAIFTTIFENITDVPSFEKAIEESIPSEKMVNQLMERVQKDKASLQVVEKKINRLYDSVVDGTLTNKELIQKREQEYTSQRDTLLESIKATEDKFKALPDRNVMLQEAAMLRRVLLEKYQSPEHQAAMTYEQRRELLHYLFEGKDHEGKPYGIYVDKRGEEVDYFFYGQLTGLRTLKGTNINYNTYTNNGHI